MNWNHLNTILYNVKLNIKKCDCKWLKTSSFILQKSFIFIFLFIIWFTSFLVCFLIKFNLQDLPPPFLNNHIYIFRQLKHATCSRLSLRDEVNSENYYLLQPPRNPCFPAGLFEPQFSEPSGDIQNHLVQSCGLKLYIARRLLTADLISLATSALAKHRCRENSCKQPLLKNTEGSVGLLHIVKATILSFFLTALSHYGPFTSKVENCTPLG